MVLRRLGIGSLVLGVALAGCGGSGGGGSASAGSASARASAAATTPSPSSSATTAPEASPSAQPAGDARAALAAAARKLGDDSLRLRLDMGRFMTVAGAADPASGKLQMRMQVGGPRSTFDVRSTGKDIYLKFSGELGRSTGDQWLRIKGDRVPRSLSFGSAKDPGDAQRLLRGITQVRRDGPLAFRGTLDISTSPTADPQSLKALGPKARAVPFTARIDTQGRLVGLTIRMDAANAALPQMTVRYFDFGTPVAVTKPSGRIVDAPQDMIEALDASGG